MAVLKYRSTDGTIKTLPITANGDGSGTIPADVMATIDQHTEDIAGLETQTQQLTTAVGAINDSLPTKYSSINPPPYPVTSVLGATGDISPSDITVDETEEYTYNYIIKPLTNIIINNSANLPSGNTFYLNFIFSEPVSQGAWAYMMSQPRTIGLICSCKQSGATSDNKGYISFAIKNVSSETINLEHSASFLALTALPNLIAVLRYIP